MPGNEDVISQRLTGRFTDLLDAIVLNWPIYATAFGIFVLAFLIYLVLGRLKPFSRLAPNPFVGALLNATLRAAVLIIGLVVALDLMNATAVLGSVLGAAGVIGIAVGFALRDVLENYLAGLLLSLRHPFARDDLVRIEGHEGRVLRMSPRATLLLGLDGNHIRLPNALVFKAVIINFTREPRRRFDFEVGVDVTADLSNVRKLVLDTLKAMDGVLDDPAPVCNVDRLGDSNVVLFIAGWMDQTRADFGRVKSEAIRLIKQALDEALIGMPEPIYNLRLLNADQTAPTVAAPSPRPAASTPSQTEAEALSAPREALSVEEVADGETEGDLLDSGAPKE